MRDLESRDDLRPGVNAALLALVLGFATSLRLYRLGALSIWLDEAYTYTRAALPAARTVAASIEKGHVPTYFLFMHYWIRLGDDEAMLRLPSAIFGVLTVGAAVVLGRIVGGARVGLATGLLVALSPLQVRYSQEARMYTMFTFAATTAMCGVIWLLSHPEQAGLALWSRATWAPASTGAPSRAARMSAWIAYALGAAATLYLHNTGVFLIATCGACWLLLFAIARGKRLPVLGNVVLANLAVLACWSFWIAHLLAQTNKVMHRFWPDFPTPRAIQLNLRMMYLYNNEQYIFIEVLLVGLVLLGGFALRQRARVAVGLTLLAVLPPILILLVSLRTPMFMPRIMLWAPIPFFALAAAGIFALPSGALASRALPYLLLCGALVGAGFTLERYYFGYTSKPPWRQVAKLLSDESHRGTFAFGARSQDCTVLNYYYERHTEPLGELRITTIAPYQLRRAVRGASTVWLVDQKRGRRAGKHRAELDKLGILSWSKRFGGVLVMKYDLTHR
jgi:mannosyltransferase